MEVDDEWGTRKGPHTYNMRGVLDKTGGRRVESVEVNDDDAGRFLSTRQRAI